MFPKILDAYCKRLFRLPKSRLVSVPGQRKVKQTWWQFLKVLNDRYRLKDGVLIILLCIYAAVGGLLFSIVECSTQNQRTREEKEHRNHMRSSLLSLIVRVPKENPSNITTQMIILNDMLLKYEKDIGVQMEFNEDCGFMSNLFYAITVFTTIGYGNKTCITRWGKTVTILYAIIGIPLMLVLIDSLGKRIFLYARHQWNRTRRFALRFHARYLQKQDPAAQWPPKCRVGSMNTVASETVTGDDIDDVDFPLHLSLGFVVGYMFICSAIFMLWESSWDYFTAFYFFFISLSTIGFGDVVPDNIVSTLVGFPFYIVGLSLVTFCINVMQAKVKRSCDVTVEQLYKALESVLSKAGNEIEISANGIPSTNERCSNLHENCNDAEEILEGSKGHPTEIPSVLKNEEEQAVNVIEISKSPKEGKIIVRKYSCKESPNIYRCGLKSPPSCASLASEFFCHRSHTSLPLKELSIVNLPCRKESRPTGIAICNQPKRFSQINIKEILQVSNLSSKTGKGNGSELANFKD